MLSSRHVRLRRAHGPLGAGRRPESVPPPGTARARTVQPSPLLPRRRSPETPRPGRTSGAPAPAARSSPRPTRGVARAGEVRVELRRRPRSRAPRRRRRPRPASWSRTASGRRRRGRATNAAAATRDGRATRDVHARGAGDVPQLDGDERWSASGPTALEPRASRGRRPAWLSMSPRTQLGAGLDGVVVDLRRAGDGQHADRVQERRGERAQGRRGGLAGGLVAGPREPQRQHRPAPQERRHGLERREAG